MPIDVVRPADPTDLPVIESLLAAADLPTEGVAEAREEFLVAVERGRVVGAIGLEPFGETGLLRSAVVDPRARSTGVGSTLVEALLERSRERGLRRLVLLTTTAEAFFARFGFRRVDRDEVPPAIRSSAEFASLCPADATVMALDLRTSPG